MSRRCSRRILLAGCYSRNTLKTCSASRTKMSSPSGRGRALDVSLNSVKQDSHNRRKNPGEIPWSACVSHRETSQRQRNILCPSGRARFIRRISFRIQISRLIWNRRFPETCAPPRPSCRDYYLAIKRIAREPSSSED